MNVNDIFESKYLKSSDLQGHTVHVKIRSIEPPEEATSGKPIIFFVGKRKGMVMNRTNCMTLAAAFGPETDGWIGAEIEVFSMKVQYQSQLVDGLRVRVLRQSRPAAPPPPPPPPPPQPTMAPVIDDAVPF